MSNASFRGPQFIDAMLQSGPHHGQRVRVPDDQDKLTFYDGPTPHHYLRLSDAPVFHHESRIARLGGGR